MSSRLVIFLFFALLVTAILPVAAQADSQHPELKGRYFLVVWSFQGPDDDLVHAHTFVSFYQGDELATGVVRPKTISWLPATGIVQPFGAEKGNNFSLDETLRMACRARRQIKSWGPFEIKPELYLSGMKRIEMLESGQVRYSMINDLPRSMNCITAAGDITGQHLDTGILWGVAASSAVVRHLSPGFLGPAPDLNGVIGLSKSEACQGRAASVASDDAGPSGHSITQAVASGLGN